MKHCIFVFSLIFTLLFIFSMVGHCYDYRLLKVTERDKNKTINCIANKTNGLWNLSCVERRLEYTDKKHVDPSPKTGNSKRLNPMEALLGTKL